MGIWDEMILCQIPVYRSADIHPTVSTLTRTGELPIPSLGWTSGSNTSLFIWPAAPRHAETVVLLNNKFSKAKDFVQIDVNAEDYYKIKEAEKEQE